MSSTPEQPEHWPSEDFVPAAELARRQGVRPITLVDDLATAVDPFGSDEEYEAATGLPDRGPAIARRQRPTARTARVGRPR